MVNAVQFAADMQDACETRNLSLADDRRMSFRIGINLSDVIAEHNDVFGDGVNVAARLQSIAEPGGICISETVYQHVHRHLAYSFEDMGKRQLKNISGNVQTYRVRLNTASAAAAAGRRRAVSHEASIVVLPFVNMSGDPEQEYFSDGITEDIITDLSKVGGLMVIARNSSFAYKRKSVDVRTVGRELGVRSVLEGSIRRAGNRGGGAIVGFANYLIRLVEAETPRDGLPEEVQTGDDAAGKDADHPGERRAVPVVPTHRRDAEEGARLVRDAEPLSRAGPVRRLAGAVI